LAVAVAPQISSAGDQQLPAQVVSDAVNHLDVQIQAAPGQFLTGQLEGRHQGRLPGDQAGQGGASTLVNTEDGQFGEEPATLFASGLLARAGGWGAIKGGDPQNEAAEQADAAGASFGTAEGPIRLVYFFWEASAQAD
jgi:hypothetical protein